MRTASAGQVVFAATLGALGIIGLVSGRFGPIWDSVPPGLPGRTALAYLCAIVALACGAGLLWQRSAAMAARVLFFYLLLWLLLIKLPYIVHTPAVAVVYESWAETAVLVAAAWVLYAAFATGWDRRRLGFATDERGERRARMLYGVAMLAFGVSHFVYLQYTSTLVPAWLPRHAAWVYFTGGAYLAAGVGILSGVYARLAATLSTVQMGLFTLLVWVPAVAVAHPDAAALREFADSWALTAGGWVVAGSCRDLAWLAIGTR